MACPQLAKADVRIARGAGSMGSFQGVEWGINYPTFMKGLISPPRAATSTSIPLTAEASTLANSASNASTRTLSVALTGRASVEQRHDSDHHSRDRLGDVQYCDAVIGLVTLDPAYKDGKYTENPVEGIKRSGMIYFPWLYSDEYLTTLKEPEPYQTALMAFGTGWSKTWDANALIIRYLASRNFDASVPFGGDMKAALARIQAKTLLLTSQTDRTIPAYLSRELYAGIKNAQASLRRLVILVNVNNPGSVLEMREAEAAARTLGLDVTKLQKTPRRSQGNECVSGRGALTVLPLNRRESAHNVREWYRMWHKSTL
jgi:pimeloyl-ACP methyl ester carboxylesterase